MGFLGKIFGGGRRENAAEAAMPYLNRINEYGPRYLDPWINRGTQSANNLPGLYDRSESLYGNTPPEIEEMANNPSAFLDKIFAKYKPSEGYKFKENRLLKEAGNTAASYGMAGTENDVENRSNLINGILDEDMQKYLANILGIQGTGQAGRERYLGGRERALNTRIQGENLGAERGYGASSTLADYLGNNAGQQGQLSFLNASQNNKNRNDRRNAILNMIGQGVGAGFGAAGAGGAFAPGGRWG